MVERGEDEMCAHRMSEEVVVLLVLLRVCNGVLRLLDILVLRLLWCVGMVRVQLLCGLRIRL